jgi:flagellar basal-body rod modification protein FlgD
MVTLQETGSVSMTTTNQVSNSQSFLDSLSPAARKAASGDTKDNELGQDAFMRLMITQMNNQDPLNPAENSEFVAQLAQFSSVEGITNLNTKVGEMAASFQSSQALQASALVGRSVRVTSDLSQLTDSKGVEGQATLPVNTSQVTARYFDSANQLVHEEILGPKQAGNIDIAWNGTLADGSRAPNGDYRVEVSALIEGQQQNLQTRMNANVDSVTLGGEAGLTLNVRGVGAVPVSKVEEIY